MSGSLPATTYRLAALPRPLLACTHRHGLARRLLPSDVGYFPRASGHRRERPHGCTQVVILICTAGSGWYRLRGVEERVGAGEVVVLPPHQAHAYGADAPSPWTIWWVHLAGRDLADLVRELPWLQGGRLAIDDHQGAVRLVGRILAIIEQGHAERHLDQAALLSWQLLALLQVQRTSTAAAADDDGVARAIRHMHQHIASPLSVAGLAQVAGWSPSHFAARFRAATGRSVLDHFLTLRMEHAAWLLDNGEDDIASVARRLGYDDAFYFSRRFRAVHGCPPTLWRGQEGRRRLTR